MVLMYFAVCAISAANLLRYLLDSPYLHAVCGFDSVSQDFPIMFH